MVSRKLSDIAREIGLTLQGPDGEVTGVNTLEKAGAHEVSFLANPKYIAQLATTKAGAVIVAPAFADQVSCALVSENPYQDFGRVLSLFAVKQGSFVGQSPLAFIHPTAQIGQNVTIYPFVFVGAGAVVGDDCTLFSGVYVGEYVQIGAKCTLYPSAVVMAACVLGDGCTLSPGAVIGADGFGYTRNAQGTQKIPQVGRVVLGSHVDIGANATIDRAALDVTTVGDGTKVDNLVQLGHNVHVGKNGFIVSQVGVSGSTTIGDNCTLAGQVGIAGHLNIGNNVTIGPQSGVAKNIPDNITMGGSPAVEQGIFMRTMALMPKFPDLFKRLTKLEKEVQTILTQKDNK